MVQNGQKWSKSPKMFKIAKNGQNRQKWSKMVKMVQNCSITVGACWCVVVAVLHKHSFLATWFSETSLNIFIKSSHNSLSWARMTSEKKPKIEIKRCGGQGCKRHQKRLEKYRWKNDNLSCSSYTKEDYILGETPYYIYIQVPISSTSSLSHVFQNNYNLKPLKWSTSAQDP